MTRSEQSLGVLSIERALTAPNIGVPEVDPTSEPVRGSHRADKRNDFVGSLLRLIDRESVPRETFGYY